MTHAERDAEDVADFESILRLSRLADYIIPITIRVVADLGVADHLADDSRSVDELAADTGADARALYRVLRALAAHEIFVETSPRCFGLTSMADLLRSDHPYSMRASYPLIAADVQAWAASC